MDMEYDRSSQASPESDPDRLQEASRQHESRKNWVRASVDEQANMPKVPTLKQQEALLAGLENRFEANMKRHERLPWDDVQERLKAHPEKLWSLHAMEETVGEPDVIGFQDGRYLFTDCAKVTPRRGVHYDEAGQAVFRQSHPIENIFDYGTAVGKASSMGIELLDIKLFEVLKDVVDLDSSTWTWLLTPAEIRASGSAYVGDSGLGHFVTKRQASESNRNGGFRGVLRV